MPQGTWPKQVLPHACCHHRQREAYQCSTQAANGRDPCWDVHGVQNRSNSASRLLVKIDCASLSMFFFFLLLMVCTLKHQANCLLSWTVSSVQKRLLPNVNVILNSVPLFRVYANYEKQINVSDTALTITNSQSPYPSLQ